MPDDQEDVALSHADTALAKMLRDELEPKIEAELEALIMNPSERTAGRVQAFRQVLGLISGDIAKINDYRPTQEAPRGS